jgi:hypothetical protein
VYGVGSNERVRLGGKSYECGRLASLGFRSGNVILAQDLLHFNFSY